MPISNTSKSEFKGLEAKLLSDRYNIEPHMINYEERSYTVPSSKNGLKIKKITKKNVERFIDRIYYYYYGTFKFNINNIDIEFKYDTDMQEYTKFEFIKFYGEQNYLIHWTSAPFSNTRDQDEWRYDTNLINYTKKQFIKFFGFENYLVHWNNAPKYLYTDLDLDTDLDTDLDY